MDIMRELIFIVLMATNLLLISSVALGQNSYPDADPTVPNSVTPTYESGFENGADMGEYHTDGNNCQDYDCCQTYEGDCSGLKRKFHEGLSYTGEA